MLENETVEDLLSCPDINLFIDQLEEGRLDPELQAHLDGCVACRERIWVVQALPAALRPELVVPERTVQRGLAGILAGQRKEEARSRRWAVAETTGLAVITTLAAILFTGSTADASPGALALVHLPRFRFESRVSSFLYRISSLSWHTIPAARAFSPTECFGSSPIARATGSRRAVPLGLVG